MAKVMIWPDIYKEHGHWLPCIHLAKTLIDVGHTVEFMGIPDTEAILAGYQATFTPILGNVYPLGHTVEDRLEPLSQRWKPHHLLPIARGDLGDLLEGEGKPDLLISGYFTGLETLMLHRKHGVPFVLITTYLRHPQETPKMHAKEKLVHLPAAVTRRLIDETVGTPGMSLDEFIRPLDEQPEIIPCPEAFDFVDEDWGKHRATVRYVEPMIQRVPLQGGSQPPDPVAGDLPANKKLIFGTAGSQVQDYEDLARRYFLALIEMMRTQGMDGFHLVLAVGDRLMGDFINRFRLGADDSTLPKNVSIYPWVSQLDIMKRAEAVFLHGGLATIKESIWEEVPMIVLPHGKDQNYNALRVRDKGIGVTTQEETLSPLELRRLFLEATASRWIKKNLAKMHSLFEQEETSSVKGSLQVIQPLLT